MYYPTSWDPFFAEYMTLAQIYHYPTQHFRYHQRQLTLAPVGTAHNSDAADHLSLCCPADDSVLSHIFHTPPSSVIVD